MCIQACLTVGLHLAAFKSGMRVLWCLHCALEDLEQGKCLPWPAWHPQGLTAASVISFMKEAAHVVAAVFTGLCIK